jgi:penicillin amidase
MRLFKKILFTIILVVFILFIGVWWYLTSLKPTYEGNLTLNSIQNETTVYFDDYGIPHIYAQSQEDALTALGYVHAQDRLFQMELIRRIAPGRLSEIFGEKMLKNDKFFVSLGIEQASEKTVKNINKNSEAYKLSIAYLNGINQYIQNGSTPIEFSLIGIKKEPFKLKDIYNIAGYMSFSFAMAQKTDPLLTILKEKLGDNYIKDLPIKTNPNSTIIKTSKQDIKNYEEMVANINEVMEKTPISPFIGSNSWVVSAKKTNTGNVLFANDPHIAYSQPAVWYEAYIKTPNYEMYGYHLAGVPFPLLGHNRNYAYGLTMFENDDLDFYKEVDNPENKNQYKTPNGFADYKTFTKTIKVKNADDVTIIVKNTRHGPIMNNVIDNMPNSNPIAMNWAYTNLDVHLLKALYTISRATKMDDVKKGASLISSPGLNIMYGDAKGNIAWWAAAKLYKLKSNSSRKLILNGATGEDDIAEYLDFSENPMAENPSWNYVYSANNQPDTIANVLYPGYYLPENRAKRIVQLLQPKNDWSKQDFAAMINDVTSSISPTIVKELMSIIKQNSLSKFEQKALTTLKNWDGSNTIKSIEPTIYNKFIYEYLKNTFEDEMGNKIFTQFLKTHLSKRVIASQIKENSSVWWDNISTKNKTETREEIILSSFKEAIKSLKNQLGDNIDNWHWGNVQTLEHKHPLGTISYLRKYFDVGPFPINGAKEVLNNRGFDYTDTGLYSVFAGPSTRRIIDFSDVENSISILPTGESGNFLSKHYKDQAVMYNEGKFRKMKMNKKEIISVSTKLTFLPKK